MTVGEAGPEVVRFGSPATVFPSGTAPGGGQVFIDARGADKPEIRRLEGIIRQLNMSVEPRAIAAVRNERNRLPKSLTRNS